ncbi:MAG: HAD family phosphatase [Oscillospiraceae bacterium]|nr:HAD family phosphatase [Oscillospiraceae bacterium]
MIKLIATDMDGTLLNDRKELPPDFYYILDELKKCDIHFVIASGRSFTTLKLNFEGSMDKLDFICDNGAYVVVNGRLVSRSILDSVKLREMLETCLSLEGVTPVLCGMKGTYFERTDEDFYNEVRKYYLNFTCVDDILSVEDEIFKVAVCDKKGPRNNALPVLSEKFAEDFTVAETGPRWIDIMNKGINKGAALEILQRELNISKAETMSFGDYFNDVELLLAAEHSYVMENAHPEMAQYAKYRAKSNNDCGVTAVIKEYLNE